VTVVKKIKRRVMKSDTNSLPEDIIKSEFSGDAESVGWARGMAQMVQCLSSKHEALNSNPSTAKTNKKN
jgi:hypothetical protein